MVNTQDVITFYGSSVDELKAELQTSIEEYLEWFPGVTRAQIEAILDHEAAAAMGSPPS